MNEVENSKFFQASNALKDFFISYRCDQLDLSQLKNDTLKFLSEFYPETNPDFVEISLENEKILCITKVPPYKVMNIIPLNLISKEYNT